MPNFVNTVDSIGDDALTDSIIDRSITEYADNNITSIGRGAFKDCSSLASIDFPSVASIGNSSFEGCSSLTSIDFPSVTSINDGAFHSCSSLVSANFPLATSINGIVFKGCSSLTSVDFPLATSINGGSAFENCSNLTTVNFPAVTTIGIDAFRSCSALTTADFPSATTIKSGAFQSCRGLTALILRNTEKVCTLSSTDAFNVTPIKTGSGYIYVPAALVDSYKTATNWSAYANQFRTLENYTVDGTTTGALDASKVNA